MFNVGQFWNPKQALLKQALKEGRLVDAKTLLFELHSTVHSSEVYERREPSYFDEIWEGLTEKTFCSMPSIKDVTIAWNVWHITRIEDISANILIADINQILAEKWMSKLNTMVKDTGNAMSDEEIIAFSNEINFNELRNYRNAVGTRTKQMIQNLKQEDLKRKIKQVQLNRVVEEGAILEHPDSIWLLDFWGKKTVSGLLLMPITRHQIVHLNDCKKLKSKCS